VNPSLRRHQRDWEDLGELDPYWAILAYPERRFGRWDLDEFFRTGAEEIARLEAEMQRLGRPARRERALDFGCGVGRLTQALAPHFERVVGVDVGKRGVEREVVAALLRVRLIPLEVVHGRADSVAGLLVGTHGVDDVPRDLQRLERHHHFVVFDEVADEHQNLLRHGSNSSSIIPLLRPGPFTMIRSPCR